MSRAYQVFMSHATKDKWVAKVLCEKIEERGAKAFRDDRDIPGGDDISEGIRQQIVQSAEMIVLLTPESAGREWIIVEAAAAWMLQKRIVCILNHVDVDAIPAIIRSKRAFRLDEIDQYLGELEARVQEHSL